MSYKVLNAGAGGLKTVGTAIEFAFPTQEIPVVMDNLLAFLAKKDKKKEGYYLNVPIALGFTQPSDAILANNYHTFKGKKVKEWCHIEILRVNPVEKEKDKKEKELYGLIQELLFGAGGRPHWGLNFNFQFSEDKIRQLYPEFDKWLSSYNLFNHSRIFDNKFTKMSGFDTASSERLIV